MAFQPQYEGIDNFNFLQSRTRTGSADQGFYDDDPANPLEFTQYLPTSLMDGRISDEVPQRSPVFCDACGYTLESLEENCLWCQFTNDEVTGAIEYPPAEAQADLPDTHENQWNDTPVEASVARQPRSPGDPYLGDFAMDPNIDPTTLGFEELPTFLWPSAEDVDVYQRWFQRVVDDGLPAGFPDLARHGHNEEGLPENQAPLPLERVLDQEFNEVNVRVPRRRRLFPEERLEVAAKRGKVCASCRRKKIKCKHVRLEGGPLGPTPGSTSSESEVLDDPSDSVERDSLAAVCEVLGLRLHVPLHLFLGALAVLFHAANLVRDMKTWHREVLLYQFQEIPSAPLA